MHTVLRSATREVVIGDDQPFCLMGERINPTGRKIFAEQLRRGDLSRIAIDVEQQVAGGATMLDVNMGVPLADEAELLAQAVTMIQGLTDLPLVIDSSVVEALEAGLGAYQGKALVNSVTGEKERLEQILPIVARHGAAVIALPNEEDEIPDDPYKRLDITEEDPRHRHGGVRHPAGGHRDRPARDADRRRHHAREEDAADHRADPRRARPQHDPRRLQRLVRHARAARAGRHVPADGHEVRPHQRDHGRARPADRRSGQGRRPAARQRRVGHGLDRPRPGRRRGGEGRRGAV